MGVLYQNTAKEVQSLRFEPGNAWVQHEPVAGKRENYSPSHTSNTLYPGAFSRSKTFSGCGNAAQKSRIVLKAIIKPVILGFETDNDSGWLSMTSDYNFFLLRLVQIF